MKNNKNKTVQSNQTPEAENPVTPQNDNDDIINVTKSVFQTAKEAHLKQLEEQELKQRELERQYAENEKKKREAYERKILEEKKELIRLKQGVIEESETIQEVREETVKLSIWQKIKNFFYHNKWWLGIAVLFVFITVYLLHNLLSKPRPDLVVLVIGESSTIGESDELEDYFESFADDFNDNGEVLVSIFYIPYSDNNFTNYSNGSDTNLTNQLQSAEAVIVIGGKTLKELIPPEEIFVDLSELYPDNPHIRNYGFYLKDTPFSERIGVDDEAVSDELFIAIRTPTKLLYSDKEDMQETYDKDFPVFEQVIEDLSE